MNKNELDESHGDPGNWKLGIFYFNKADPRLLPPKRRPGIGVTTNFANWRSVALLIFLMILVCGLIEGLLLVIGHGA